MWILRGVDAVDEAAGADMCFEFPAPAGLQLGCHPANLGSALMQPSQALLDKVAIAVAVFELRR